MGDASHAGSRGDTGSLMEYSATWTSARRIERVIKSLVLLFYNLVSF